MAIRSRTVAGSLSDNRAAVYGCGHQSPAWRLVRRRQQAAPTTCTAAESRAAAQLLVDKTSATPYGLRSAFDIVEQQSGINRGFRGDVFDSTAGVGGSFRHGRPGPGRTWLRDRDVDVGGQGRAGRDRG